MMEIKGGNGAFPASGSGHSAEPEPCFTVSAVPASVPNAPPLLDASDLRACQAALICEYGNLGWTWDDRCEMHGACDGCQKRALLVMPNKPRTSDDWFASGIETEGHDRADGHGAKHESPVPKADAQGTSQ